jgi:type VI secretion system protein VasD
MPGIGRRGALALPALLLARCAGPAPPVLDLTVIAGADQNPDAAGQPTSVAIRLYQLAAIDAFATADVFALTDREAATLGADDLGSEQLVLGPGERHPVQHPLQPGARFLGAIALFREIDRASWRAQAPLAANGTSRLVLVTAGMKVSFA